YPGADDNASGIAGLIELAELLGKTELPIQLELVAYTLEEPPFFRSPVMGSAIHAQSLKQQGVPVRAMFALEMIGYFSDAPGSDDYGHGFLPQQKLSHAAGQGGEAGLQSPGAGCSVRLRRSPGSGEGGMNSQFFTL